MNGLNKLPLRLLIALCLAAGAAQAGTELDARVDAYISKWGGVLPQRGLEQRP